MAGRIEQWPEAVVRSSEDHPCADRTGLHLIGSEDSEPRAIEMRSAPDAVQGTDRGADRRHVPSGARSYAWLRNALGETQASWHCGQSECSNEGECGRETQHSSHF